MRLTFCGAARQVTGSMFLLETGEGYRILIDCGMDMTRSQESPEGFPFDPSDIDLVLLTHAHVDHSGRLPELIRQGYNGQILCTSPTLGLTQLLLNDSASLSSRKLKRLVNRTYRYAHRVEETVTMTYREVEATMERFVTLAFHQRFEIRDTVFVTFIPVGHLLGAASILLEVVENGETKKLLFSGDIGRKNYPLLPDPAVIPEVDYLICESTYGNRSHIDKDNAEDILEKVITETCVQKAGRLIIPAFSVGRTQSVLFTLHKLYRQGRLPRIRIFTDSPMAEVSSRMYEEYVKLLNEEAKEIFSSHQTLFDFENLHYVANFRESKAISNYYEPCIIIAASGMLTGGRMQMHIKKNLGNPYCTFLMIGYAAEGTPGHKLMNGGRYLRIDGRDIPVAAKIQRTDIYSGHADREDLMDFFSLQNKEKLKNIFLVHGELQSMEELKIQLEGKGYSGVEIPQKGQAYEI